MWGTDNELSLVLADSLLIANSGDLELRKRVLSGGGLIWSQRDYVHLTVEGYKDLTETILDCNFVSSEYDRASGAGSSSSSTMENRNRL
jgi:hypothetical protein